jgi:hypothetical protein
MKHTRIIEIEERLEKSTQGNWIYNQCAVKTNEKSNYGYPPTDGVICGLFDGEYIENSNYQADGEFIAHAKSDIEYLLAENKRLREVLKTKSKSRQHNFKVGDRVRHIKDKQSVEGTITVLRNSTAWVQWENGILGTPHLRNLILALKQE